MYTVLAVLLAELLTLYMLGSYAMSRLGALGVYGGPLLRLGFYLLVMPGVILHESAHYAACRITLTPVERFVPFAPRLEGTSGRVVLGYVSHRRRNPLVGAVIGLAPAAINPLALLALTSFVTPLDSASVLPAASSGAAGMVDAALILGDQALEFARAQPGVFCLWAYLAVSLALGSCPSREDLAAVPAAAGLVLAAALGYSALPGATPPEAFTVVPALAVSVYLLPVMVAAAAALATGVLRA